MRLIKWLSLILILANVSTTFAASRVYQIDLIIFSHPTTKALLSENWPANPVLPIWNNAVNLTETDAASPNALYQILPSHRFKFSREAAILAKQPHYRVLVNTAWLQPAFPTKRATWIHVSGGSDIQLNGQLKISRPYLFQVDADLVLTIPKTVLQQIAPNDANKIAATQFVLKQTASLRASQIYYFDHPLFGAIIKITPLNEKVNESDL